MDDELREAIIRTDERTKTIQETLKTVDKRLDSHASRLKALEWGGGVVAGVWLVAQFWVKEKFGK